MNLIPKINGTALLHKGRLTIHEPLTYSGGLMNENYTMRFGLLPAAEGMLLLNTDPRIPEEGYRLDITSAGIELAASTPEGQFYGLVTLESLIRENRGGLLELDSKIPNIQIEDAPAFSHRGFMLDMSGGFLEVTEIERLLEQMALLKLNKFHWLLPPGSGYAPADISEVEAFAADRGIEVIYGADHPDGVLAAAKTGPSVRKMQERIFPWLLVFAECAWAGEAAEREDLQRRAKAYEKVLKDYGIRQGRLSELEGFGPDEGKAWIL